MGQRQLYNLSTGEKHSPYVSSSIRIWWTPNVNGPAKFPSTAFSRKLETQFYLEERRENKFTLLHNIYILMTIGSFMNHNSNTWKANLCNLTS